MDRVVKSSRVIPVLNLDGGYGRLDTSQCLSIRGDNLNDEYVNFEEHYLHRTKNNRWYAEHVDRSWSRRAKGICSELTLDNAIGWIINRVCEYIEELDYIKLLEDVSQSATPQHGGQIVVKCLNCYKREKAKGRSQSTKQNNIMSVLNRAKGCLSGREIAARANLKYDSHFRSILSRLVLSGVVVKQHGKNSYVLPENLKS